MDTSLDNFYPAAHYIKNEYSGIIPEDFIKIMKGYCKFLATNTKVSTSVAKLLSEKRSQNAIENVNQEVHSKLYYEEIELLGKADVSNNLYMTYCFD